jgi:hypothetical protein
MEAGVATAPEAVQDPVPSHDGRAEATRSTEELFQYSGFVHRGAGADECPDKDTGACVDDEHFHAWVCLPNGYQIRDINDKARASRARKARALRDPASDSHVILEGELEELQREHYPELLQAIAQRHIDLELADIVNEVQDQDQFEHQAQDAEEFQRLQEVDEADRDPEEYERLQAQMLDYAESMSKIIEKRRTGDVEKLKTTPVDRVMSEEREWRIKNITNESYMHTYYTWVIYTCSRRPVAKGFPTQRVFAKPEDQSLAAPEVTRALREKIRDLENGTRAERRGDAAGNS